MDKWITDKWIRIDMAHQNPKSDYPLFVSEYMDDDELDLFTLILNRAARKAQADILENRRCEK